MLATAPLHNPRSKNVLNSTSSALCIVRFKEESLHLLFKYIHKTCKISNIVNYTANNQLIGKWNQDQIMLILFDIVLYKHIFFTTNNRERQILYDIEWCHADNNSSERFICIIHSSLNKRVFMLNRIDKIQQKTNIYIFLKNPTFF